MPKLLLINPVALEVGKRIRAYRELHGLSQKDFADRCGVTQPQLCRYEGGTELPRGPVLEKLADAMKCTMDYLYRGRVEDVAGTLDAGLRDSFLELHNFSPECRRAVIEAAYAHMSREIMEKRALEPRKDPDTGIIAGKPANGRKV
jgi:transcriptional regulator with XRE-family HTH domain